MSVSTAKDTTAVFLASKKMPAGDDAGVSHRLEICYERKYFNKSVKDCQLETDMDREWYMNYNTETLEDYIDEDFFYDRDLGPVDDFFDHDDDEIDFLDY